MQTTTSSLDALRHAGGSSLPEVALVLKAADQGSLEAVMHWISDGNKKIQDAEIVSSHVEAALTKLLATGEQRDRMMHSWSPLRVVRSGVGPVNPSDAKYAEITGAVVLAFGVPLLDDAEQVRDAHLPT